MGCGFSKKLNTSQPNKLQTFGGNKNSSVMRSLVQTYEQLDVRICELENSCPSPRLTVAEAWVEFLQETFELETKGEDKLEPTDENLKPVAGSESQDISQLALQLGILQDAKKASRHENFFASISSVEAEAFSKQIYSEIISSAKVRVHQLLEKYNHLSNLYEKQDSLLVSANNGAYYTDIEETLDLELENARNLRDKLGAAIEQWRTCAFLLTASFRSSLKGINSWRQLKQKASPNECIKLALDSRKAVLASLITLHCAQSALPSVEIQHISKRELATVRLLTNYMLTDISQDTRFLHTQRILEGFHRNISESVTWFRNTYESSLKKDFVEANKKVEVVARSLRQHRMEILARVNTSNLPR